MNNERERRIDERKVLSVLITFPTLLDSGRMTTEQQLASSLSFVWYTAKATTQGSVLLCFVLWMLSVSANHKRRNSFCLFFFFLRCCCRTGSCLYGSLLDKLLISYTTAWTELSVSVW